MARLFSPLSYVKQQLEGIEKGVKPVVRRTETLDKGLDSLLGLYVDIAFSLGFRTTFVRIFTYVTLRLTRIRR